MAFAELNSLHSAHSVRRVVPNYQSNHVVFYKIELKALTLRLEIKMRLVAIWGRIVMVSANCEVLIHSHDPVVDESSIFLPGSMKFELINKKHLKKLLKLDFAKGSQKPLF